MKSILLENDSAGMHEAKPEADEVGRRVDLNFFFDPPRLTVVAELWIEALAPLSMVSSIPGQYYRSERRPTIYMIYGLLENALGLHLPSGERSKLLNAEGFLRKKAQSRIRAEVKAERLEGSWLEHPWLSATHDISSGCKYTSILQHHLAVDTVYTPAVMIYEDYWNRLVRETGTQFIGASRHTDITVDDAITLSNTANPTRPQYTKGKPKRNPKTKRPECHPLLVFAEKRGIGIRTEAEALQALRLARDFYERLPSTNPERFLQDPKLDRLPNHPFNQLLTGTSEKVENNAVVIYPAALRELFPMYSVSPRVREYVVPEGPYRVRIRTTRTLADRLAVACEDPQAPLYLGTSEGWVDVQWHEMNAEATSER